MQSKQKQAFRHIKRNLERRGFGRLDEVRKKLRARLFPQQRAVLEDTSRMKTVRVGRRGGKSYGLGAYLVDMCLERDHANCLYIAKTRVVARNILWRALKHINNDFEIGSSFHNTDLTMTFPNGSVLTLAGADSKDEIEKYRGQAFDLVVIDEAKSFPARLLDELVHEVLTPALADTLGTIVLGGTPGAILRGVFYEASEPRASCETVVRPYDQKDEERWFNRPFEWSMHAWSVKDNIAMPHLWEEALKRKKARGWTDNNPIWRREYLGEWVSDNTSFVYSYSPARNTWKPDRDSKNKWGLPDGHEWKYILGLDLGYDDPFAMVVNAYSDSHPCMYSVYDWCESRLTVKDMAEQIFRVKDMFGEFEAIIGDQGGLGKALIASLNEMYDVHIEAAEKKEKRDFVELLNSDLVDGRFLCKIDSTLAEEMSRLTWDESGMREDKWLANHACDANLYTWRYAYHHFYKERVEEPEVGTADYYKDLEKQSLLEARQRRLQEQNDLDHWAERVITEAYGGESRDWFDAISEDFE